MSFQLMQLNPDGYMGIPWSIIGTVLGIFVLVLFVFIMFMRLQNHQAVREQEREEEERLRLEDPKNWREAKKKKFQQDETLRRERRKADDTYRRERYGDDWVDNKH